MQALIEQLGLSDAPLWMAAGANIAIKGVALLAIAWLVVLCLRRASAAARHVVWFAALVGVLILPILTVTLPQWRLNVLADAAPSATDTTQEDEPAGDPLMALAPPVITPSAPETAVVLPPVGADAVPDTGDPVAFAPAPEAVPTPQREPAPIREAPAVSDAATPIPWAGIIAAVWLAGVAVTLAFWLVGALGVRAILRQSKPATADEHKRLLEQGKSLMGADCAISLRLGPDGCMPLTFGTVRPVVVLPADVSEWPADRQRAVLLHELAHIKRRDCLTQSIAHLACALHWFNPLAWLATRQLRVEREKACDDLVLNAGSKAADYANDLLVMTREHRTRAITGVAAVAMARPSRLEGRLLALLDGSRNRRNVSARALAIAIVATALFALPLAAMQVAQEPPATCEAETTPPDPTPRQATLPDADTRGVGVVLDLATGHMLSLPNKPDERADFVAKMSKGDIAWDHALIALRDASVAVSAGGQWLEIKPSMEEKPMRTASYRISPPVRLRITTGDGEVFTLDFLSEGRNGAQVRWIEGELDALQLPGQQEAPGPAQADMRRAYAMLQVIGASSAVMDEALRAGEGEKALVVLDQIESQIPALLEAMAGTPMAAQFEQVAKQGDALRKMIKSDKFAEASQFIRRIQGMGSAAARRMEQQFEAGNSGQSDRAAAQDRARVLIAAGRQQAMALHGALTGGRMDEADALATSMLANIRELSKLLDGHPSQASVKVFEEQLARLAEAVKRGDSKTALSILTAVSQGGPQFEKQFPDLFAPTSAAATDPPGTDSDTPATIAIAFTHCGWPVMDGRMYDWTTDAGKRALLAAVAARIKEQPKATVNVTAHRGLTNSVLGEVIDSLQKQGITNITLSVARLHTYVPVINLRVGTNRRIFLGPEPLTWPADRDELARHLTIVGAMRPQPRVCLIMPEGKEERHFINALTALCREAGMPDVARDWEMPDDRSVRVPDYHTYIGMRPDGTVLVGEGAYAVGKQDQQLLAALRALHQEGKRGWMYVYVPLDGPDRAKIDRVVALCRAAGFERVVPSVASGGEVRMPAADTASPEALWRDLSRLAAQAGATPAPVTDAGILSEYGVTRGVMRDGKPWSGAFIWSSHKTPVIVEAYRDGKKHGLSLGFHSRGALHWEGRYVEGRKHGVFRLWSPDGRLHSTTVYEHGQEVRGSVEDHSDRGPAVTNPTPEADADAIARARKAIKLWQEASGVIKAGKMAQSVARLEGMAAAIRELERDLDGHSFQRHLGQLRLDTVRLRDAIAADDEKAIKDAASRVDRQCEMLNDRCNQLE